MLSAVLIHCTALMPRSCIGQDTDVPWSIVEDIVLLEISPTYEIIVPQGSFLTVRSIALIALIDKIYKTPMMLSSLEQLFSDVLTSMQLSFLGVFFFFRRYEGQSRS